MLLLFGVYGIPKYQVIGEGNGILPTVFPVLRQLKLKTWLSRDCILGMKHLLENSCNLDRLIMEMTWEPCSELRHMYTSCNEAEVDPTILRDFWTTDYLKIQDIWLNDSLLECNFSYLKFVKVWTTVGGGNDLEFIRILLKNAVALEKLTIINSKGDPLCSEWQLMEFRVLAFQRASSNVEILFSQA